MSRPCAHITLFSRRSAPLEETKEEILATCPNRNQDINTVTINMGDAQMVDEAFKRQPRPADILYCVAGGNHGQNGFFVDITAKDLEDCMRNNYYSAAYAAKSMLDIWIADDASVRKPTRQRHRRIIFINSAAAFLGLPGSIAYTTAKCAVRALADTLRIELLRNDCAASTYSIHIAFPGDFVSPGFMKEQQTKVALNKTIQGLNHPIEQLKAKFPSSDKVASLIIHAVDRGDFIICEDSMAASVLFANMQGPSPKRGWGVFDALLSPVMNLFVMPYLRWKWEGLTRKDGEKLQRSRE
ncbi:oxidoreductase [Coccidioides immitis RS]|uniref:Oxidoreductase n=1 Tax=Coccidioides immitis (strain RS) TaxID=246410 RepID=J3K6K3_COCIM|nr:oxidoreductase [Coccidioides immitis RS]EAS30222.3 oxidoreductase [Coccidioides immitis RS]